MLTPNTCNARADFGVSRSERVLESSVKADKPQAPDNSDLELSTHVKVLAGKEVVPRDDPSSKWGITRLQCPSWRKWSKFSGMPMKV
jgi:hypothetical protein